MPTIILSILFVALPLVSLGLWALFLRLGLHWAKVPDVRWRRIVLAAVLTTVLPLPILIGSLYASPTGVVTLLLLGIAELVASLLIVWLVIMWVFKTSFLRAIQAWLPTLISTFMMAAIGAFVVRTFVVEAFVASANSMAPTLLGKHLEGTCVECGNPAFCSPTPYVEESDAPLMICQGNFHISRPADRGERVRGPDRFFVAKYMKPKRWDIIAFRVPDRPSQIYAKRLVGLPGEEIEIKDGRVWVNGEMLPLPDEIASLKYLPGDNILRDDYWGSPNRRARLGHDEYFVLGDFSAQSYDSRYWEEGAPSHNPFAVPRSHLHGVVTHIYWPPSRWRSFE